MNGNEILPSKYKLIRTYGPNDRYAIVTNTDDTKALFNLDTKTMTKLDEKVLGIGHLRDDTFYVRHYIHGDGNPIQKAIINIDGEVLMKTRVNETMGRIDTIGFVKLTLPDMSDEHNKRLFEISYFDIYSHRTVKHYEYIVRNGIRMITQSSEVEYYIRSAKGMFRLDGIPYSKLIDDQMIVKVGGIKYKS